MYTIAEDIKQEIAEAVVRQAQQGWSNEYHGEYYAVDTDGDQVLDEVIHAQYNRPWNPWHNEAVAIPVDDCIDWSDGISLELENNDDDPEEFERTVAFALDYLLATVSPAEVE